MDPATVLFLLGSFPLFGFTSIFKDARDLILNYGVNKAHVKITNTCKAPVYIHCYGKGMDFHKNRDFGKHTMDHGKTVEWKAWTVGQAFVTQILCYIDFKNQPWGNLKGYWAVLIADRCGKCEWRIVDKGGVELKQNDNSWKPFKVEPNDALATVTCKGKSCSDREKNARN